MPTVPDDDLSYQKYLEAEGKLYLRAKALRRNIEDKNPGIIVFMHELIDKLRKADNKKNEDKSLSPKVKRLSIIPSPDGKTVGFKEKDSSTVLVQATNIKKCQPKSNQLALAPAANVKSGAAAFGITYERTTAQASQAAQAAAAKANSPVKDQSIRSPPAGVKSKDVPSGGNRAQDAVNSKSPTITKPAAGTTTDKALKINTSARPTVGVGAPLQGKTTAPVTQDNNTKSKQQALKTQSAASSPDKRPRDTQQAPAELPNKFQKLLGTPKPLYPTTDEDLDYTGVPSLSPFVEKRTKPWNPNFAVTPGKDLLLEQETLQAQKAATDKEAQEKKLLQQAQG